MSDNIIILKSAFGKTQGLEYFIQPCKDPNTGMYPDCVREIEDEKTGKMLLSESDKQFLSKGGVLIPANKPIKVKHGTTFDLDNPLQRALWDAIKHSELIAMSRTERDRSGNTKIDGEMPYLGEDGVVKGLYGLADLYVERPGIVSKVKNDKRKTILKAQNLIMGDTIDGWLVKCKLLEKDMTHANVNDVEDYLFNYAERLPEKIIELYTGTTTAIRLLLIEALDKHVIYKRDGLLIYSDDIVLGASMDAAVVFLSNPENIRVKELIQQETYPDLYKKDTKKK